MDKVPETLKPTTS